MHLDNSAGFVKKLEMMDSSTREILTATVGELKAELEVVKGSSLDEVRSSLKTWTEETFATSAGFLKTYDDLTAWIEGRFTEAADTTSARFTEAAGSVDKLRMDLEKRPVFAGEDRRPKDSSTRIVDR